MHCAGFNTQPPEGGWPADLIGLLGLAGFNTQPPEGGWPADLIGLLGLAGFNTQPPEGGCRYAVNEQGAVFVSTHSRPKAAVSSSPDKSHH